MTIVKRVVRRRYSTIPNEVFDDASLTGEELGLLTFLLSRPNDWAVRPFHLAKRMHWGRDKVYRILGLLVEKKWIERKQERLPETGKFDGIEYIVYDEPVAGLTEPSAEAPSPEPPLPEIQEADKSISTITNQFPLNPPGSAVDKPYGPPRKEERAATRPVAARLTNQGEWELKLKALFERDGDEILDFLNGSGRLTTICRALMRGNIGERELAEIWQSYTAAKRTAD